MSKTRKWHTKALYLVVALVLTLGLVLPVAAVGGDDGYDDGYYVDPTLAVNVKGACEEFCAYNASGVLTAPDKWDILAGVKLTAADIELVDGELGPEPSATACITIRSLKPGDVHPQATFQNEYTVTPKGEKKWGAIEYTELEDLTTDGDFTVDGGIVVAVGEQEELQDTVTAWYYWGEEVGPHEYFHTAAHAVVHWWAFSKSKLVSEGVLDDLEALVGCGKYLIENPEVKPEWQDDAPYDLLESIYRGTYPGMILGNTTEADFTWFENGVAGVDGPPADDCNVAYVNDANAATLHSKAGSGATDLYEADGLFNVSGGTYIKTMTHDGDPDAAEHGTTTATVSNDGLEEVVFITLVEYPWEFNGENPVCIEIGYKKYTEVPEAQVKTPQIRWAGEKIVLEKDWGVSPTISMEPIIENEGVIGIAIDATAYIAGYSREGESIGVLEPIEFLDAVCIPAPEDLPDWIPTIAGNICIPILDIVSLPTGADQVFTTVDFNGVSECILASEQCGEADVDATLYMVDVRFEYYFDLEEWAVFAMFTGPVRDHGFLVYFLEFEDVVLAEDLGPEGDFDVTTLDSINELTPALEDAEVAVQVRGFFDYRHSRLMATTRDAKLLDVDGDGVFDYVLPAGRYVLPDDWWKLAGTKDISLRPNFDLMDQANLDGIDSAAELGPYDTAVVTTTPLPGEAEWPCIGPFNTLQRWSADDMWVSEAATVPSSLWPPSVRNTVVPDGILDWFDCPMPQALVLFDIITSSEATAFSGLDKGNLEGYGYVGAPKVYQSPFYAVEIPANWWIPPGYNWDSWGGDDPYDYWTDLSLDSIIADTTESPADTQDVEVYCDNHGIAGVSIDSLSESGWVTITATAEFPYPPKRGKYGPRVSDEITAQWGPVDLNPHFVVDDATPEVGIGVEFDPTTTDGGKLPYTRARWDWEGDGIWDYNSIDEGTAPMAIVTHAYAAEGYYWPCLEITDSSSPAVVRYECRGDDDPIVVGNPAVCDPTPTPDVGFASIAGELGIVCHYEGAGVWGIYWPAGSMDTLGDLQIDEVYVIYVNNDCTLDYFSQSYALTGGDWNYKAWNGC